MCEYCTTEQERKPLYTIEQNSSKVTAHLVENMLTIDTTASALGERNIDVTVKARTFVKFCPMCGERVSGKFNLGDNVYVFNAPKPASGLNEIRMIHDFENGKVVLDNGEKVLPKLLIKV